MAIHASRSRGRRKSSTCGPSGVAAQARMRERLRAKDWKCHPMIESRATTLRQVSTLPFQRGSFVIAAETVLRTSRPSESQRG